MPLQLAVEDSFETFGHVEELLGEMRRRTYYRFARSVSWQPLINMYEDEQHYYLCVQLAGIPKEEIHVDVIGKAIVVKGDRPVPMPPRASGNAMILTMEINYGAFERKIDLPDQADMQSVTAKLSDGFLWITVQKRA